VVPPKVTDLESGRTNQKLRTRNALLAAARALIAKGGAPTVEDAAESAAISRTTAYRYFKNQAELLAAAHPELHVPLLPANAPAEVEARLDLLVKELAKRLIANEAQYRTMLRLSLEEGRDKSTLFLRQGRAIGWIEEALEPARTKLGKAHFRRLVLAVRASVGIEALVWLTDVARLSRDEAARNMQWSARALLRSALAERANLPHGT
jgi:AcrR family transcriptional regulator